MTRSFLVPCTIMYNEIDYEITSGRTLMAIRNVNEQIIQENDNRDLYSTDVSE